jgi:hypothetical protein
MSAAPHQVAHFYWMSDLQQDELSFPVVHFCEYLRPRFTEVLAAPLFVGKTSLGTAPVPKQLEIFC